MKTRKNLFVAALLVASAAMTGCSGELAQTDTPVVEQGGQVVYNVSIPATKDAGVVTRALATSGTDDASLGATWAEGDVVYAYYVDGETETYVGKLTPGTTGTASTTLTGTLTKTGGFAAADNLKLYYLKPKAAGDDTEYTGTTYFGDYSGQVGTVAAIGSGCDYATANVTVSIVAPASVTTANILKTSDATFSHQQAVTKFSFTYNNSAADVSSLTISATGSLTGGPLTVAPASATSDLFVAMHNGTEGSQTYTFTATVNNQTYTATKSVALADGSYYKTTIALAKSASGQLTFDAIGDQTYQNAAITPAITVKDGDYTLVAGTDYETSVAYSNNTDVGTATVTITCKGNYAGTANTTFQIVKATPVISIAENVENAIIDKDGTLTIGASATLGATIDRTQYASSNTGVATVSDAGVITAVAAGEATITVKTVGTDNLNVQTKTLKVYVREGISGGINQPGNAQNW